MSNGGVIARKKLAVQVIDFFVRSLENEKVPIHYAPIYDYPLEQTLTRLVALYAAHNQLATPSIDGDLGGVNWLR